MGKNILLVDNEVNEINKKALECEGFQVTCAESAKDALNVLNGSKPDLMITEIMLENIDSGFGLAKIAKDKYPEMPVIILSDVVRQTGILFELGSADEKAWIKADKFINKPVNPAKLACKIKSLLG